MESRGWGVDRAWRNFLRGGGQGSKADTVLLGLSEETHGGRRGQDRGTGAGWWGTKSPLYIILDVSGSGVGQVV